MGWKLFPAMTEHRTENKVDPALLRGLAAGDERAIEQIYELYGRPVFALLVRMLGDRAEAEDVQQKVFTEVWKRGASYDPERSSLLGWILQIARSRAIDNLRKNRPTPIAQDEDFPTEIDPGSGFSDEVAEQILVAQMLDRLPREESEMLRARFFLGKSQSEIADETGVALGTVKMRMVDGLRRMRELLEEGDAL